MATRKKSTRAKKRATGAAIKGLPKTKKFGGKTYTKSTCGKTKTAAKATAKRVRKSGKNARVVKDPKTGRHCVFTRGRAKSKKR